MTALRTTNWDAVITSAPLDKQAAVVRDGRSEAVEVKIENSFSVCPPVRDYAGLAEFDLRGKRFGSLTVIGLGERNSSWVCGCDCGRFAIMKAKGLRVQAERGRAMCGECDYLKRLRAGEIISAEQRLILRNEKQARAQGVVAFDAAAHPHFDRLLGEFLADGVDESDAIASISRWIQLRLQKARARASASVEDGTPQEVRK